MWLPNQFCKRPNQSRVETQNHIVKAELRPNQTRDPTRADKRPNLVFKADKRPNQTRVETQPCFQRAGCADNPVVREAHLCRAA